MQMEILESADGYPIARLIGRLDAAGADAIGLRFTAAMAAGRSPTLVDLSQVSFVASLGIRLLVSTAKAARAKGQRMVIFGAQPEVQETFEQAALDQILDLAATEAAARELLAS